MKILVTGVGGFVGHAFVNNICLEHDVYALFHTALDHVDNRWNCIIGDLTDKNFYQTLPSSIDVVVHLAQANVGFPEKACELFSVNTQSTVLLLDYALRAGAKRFLFASSGDVYGDRNDHCLETDPANPQSFYAVTKYSSELMIRAYGDKLSFCILRLFRPYGPGQRKRVIPNIISDVRHGRPISVHMADHPLNTPVYIDDVVECFRRSLTSSFCGVLNIAGDEVISLKDIARMVGKIENKNVSFEQTTKMVSNCLGRNTLMKSVLGSWDMISMQSGLDGCMKEIGVEYGR